MASRYAGLASFLAAWALLWLSPTAAQAQCASPAAQIVRIANRVEHKVASTDVFVPATVNLNVCEGDSIRAGERSRATVAFLDRSVVLTIEQNTEWVVRRPSEPGRTLIDLVRGAILFFTRQPLEIQTPFVNATVEGTEFLVRVEDDRTLITVFEGRVQATNPLGSLTLTSNQSAVVPKGQAPQLQVIVRPRDAVQWALYYQPLLAGDSLAQLEQIPEVQRDARFYVRRAGLLLGVGRLDEARADIKQALDRDPNDGDAYALLTVIAVALNDRVEALANGREAVKRSPRSAASRVALSYALQANFELEAARDELAQAVVDQPDDARAWARLAEIRLSLGDLDRALEAAERAARLAPDVARTSTVLGFAALARVDTSGARTAFERAIALESDSPLARLGLGLARIREGDLGGGRHEIEIAAALSPDDSIIRSYLGKAYFEEKREPLPAAQFELAKQLDPRDPTSWFYDAIRKQTLNRPIEALQDLQQSIDLNDNRAIYRSDLGLDDDLTARSASLARIYSDLGFENLALVEGWKSVNVDQSNYSAHRFLADSYAALPRHNVARVSELLQSQLRQPINSTPLQPELAESELFIQEGAGPSQLAFNEFTPLFMSDGFAVQANGLAGKTRGLADDLVIAGVLGNVSFSVGQFHSEADGFRVNNDQNHNIYNAFVQAAVSPRTNVQAEYRSRNFRRGDLLLRFQPQNFFRNQRNLDDVESLRFGARQQFSPSSNLIANVSLQRADVETFRPRIAKFATDEQAYISEVQHLYRTPRFTLASGVGRVKKDSETAESLLFLPFPVPPSVSSTDVSHTNVYLYSQARVVRNVDVTLGGSGDFFRGPQGSPNQFNPKTGVIWTPFSATTVRGAAFRTLRRTLIANQTIEPTQVAGFNQLFDDDDASDVWRYGVAVDQRIAAGLYAGAELSKRDLDVPVFATSGLVEETIEEKGGRGYFYWTPHARLAVSTDYQYEQSDRSIPFEDDFTELTSHRLALGGNFFHPSGFRGGAKGSYVNQRGVFQQSALGISVLSPDEDSFWIVDVSAGYRLPKRFGLITLLVKNIFDKRFKYQETDPVRPSFVPDRRILLRVSLFFKNSDL